LNGPANTSDVTFANFQL